MRVGGEMNEMLKCFCVYILGCQEVLEDIKQLRHLGEYEHLVPFTFQSREHAVQKLEL